MLNPSLKHYILMLNPSLKDYILMLNPSLKDYILMLNPFNTGDIKFILKSQRNEKLYNRFRDC